MYNPQTPQFQHLGLCWIVFCEHSWPGMGQKYWAPSWPGRHWYCRYIILVGKYMWIAPFMAREKNVNLWNQGWTRTSLLSLYDECFEFKSLKIKGLTNILHPSLPWKSSISIRHHTQKIVMSNHKSKSDPSRLFRISLQGPNINLQNQNKKNIKK